jgi:cell division protease FtsH
VHKVSIIPRGIGALGYTMQRPTEDRFLMTREELENKMAVLLGGRAAEYLVFEHLSTGAADDLAKATDIARAIVTRYGMSSKLGHVSYEHDNRAFLSADLPSPWPKHKVSEETAAEIDLEVRRIVQAAFDHAVEILSQRLELLHRVAGLLLEKETLEETELMTLIKNGTPSASGGAAAGQPDRTAESQPNASPDAELLDEALEETFPASDPVAVVLPGHG